MENLVLKYFILSTVILVVFANENKNKCDLLDKFLPQLDTDGDRVSLRAYADLPDTDIFISWEIFNLRPSKFVNYTASIVPLFDKWDENKLADNLKTTFVFLNQTELVKDQRIESKTNLRRFLMQKDQYTSETHVEYLMPDFIREHIQLPSILECEMMKKDKFQSAVSRVLELSFYYCLPKKPRLKDNSNSFGFIKDKDLTYT